MFKQLQFMMCSLAVAVVLLAFDSTARLEVWGVVRQINEHGSSIAEWLLYRRRVNFGGIDQEVAASIEPLLPQERSTLWWYANMPQIEALVRRHRLVLGAKLAPCAALELGCFELEIEQRLPHFLALVENEGLILGQDGGILASAPPDSELFVGLAGQLPVLGGFSRSDISSDLLRSRFAQLRSVVRIVERETGLRVRALVQEGGDLRVSLATLSYPVIFPRDTLAGYGSEALLEWEKELVINAQRLRALLAELESAENGGQQIERIDFGVPNMAVVGLKNQIVSSSSR